MKNNKQPLLLSCSSIFLYLLINFLRIIADKFFIRIICFGDNKSSLVISFVDIVLLCCVLLNSGYCAYFAILFLVIFQTLNFSIFKSGSSKSRLTTILRIKHIENIAKLSLNSTQFQLK